MKTPYLLHCLHDDPLPVPLFTPPPPVYEQESFGLDMVQLAREEFAWLDKVTVPATPSPAHTHTTPSPTHANALQTLLAGHLQFTRTLFSVYREDLVELGQQGLGNIKGWGFGCLG